MPETTAAPPQTPIEPLSAARLSSREMLRLIALKREILAGRRSELTPEYKRAAFARYLFERGLLHD